MTTNSIRCEDDIVTAMFVKIIHDYYTILQGHPPGTPVRQGVIQHTFPQRYPGPMARPMPGTVLYCICLPTIEVIY